MEKAGGKLGWLRCCIKCPVVGQRMHAQGFHGAIFISRDLCFDVVVTTKTSAAQVLGAILNPLDWLACCDRRNYRAHIARVDRDLLAKAPTDTRRDDADTVLR